MIANQAMQGANLHRQEIASNDGTPAGTQKLVPGHGTLPSGSRLNALPFQDFLDGGAAKPLVYSVAHDDYRLAHYFNGSSNRIHSQHILAQVQEEQQVSIACLSSYAPRHQGTYGC